MEKLIENLKKCHSTNFVLYTMIHNFHWNVRGENFFSYHSFFENGYELTYDYVDRFGEEIRSLDIETYATGTLKRFLELSYIKESETIPSADDMVSILIDSFNKMLALLGETNNKATELGCSGLSNFLEEVIDKYTKYLWMLKAHKK